MTSLSRKGALALATLLAAGAARAQAPEPPTFVYPQSRSYGTHKAILHAPQLSAWPDFASFDGAMAIEFMPDGGTKKLLATAAFSGKTEVDLGERLVYVTDVVVKEVKFAAKNTDAYAAAVKDGVRKGRLEVPLDVFLLGLDDSILDRPPPPGFKKDAPAIIVSRTPAIVLFVNGTPVTTDLPDTGLKLVVNANWPLVTDAKSSVYYLLDRQVWLTSKKLAGPWAATRNLPKGLNKLAKVGDHAMIAAAVPAPETTQAVSTVHRRELPTELIVLDGEPKLEEIPGTGAISYVTNTDSALFKLGTSWYYLVSGRWFTTIDPFQGTWSFVDELPSGFAAIPADHKLAYVRSAVRGTLEAKVAALESLLPKRKAVTTDTKPAIEVNYAGQPQFEAVPDTTVSRAVNTTYDVILFNNTYYLVYAGVWYSAVAPVGPWTVAMNVPKEIYAIPPSSPSYHVTQVTVVETTPTTVVYQQTPSYSSNVYVVYGVPWYGTGYYYYPYIYGHYYYPYYVAYGHGHYYNSVTGGYGSRSVWYGPYGGYSYTQGYNPRTGRYGYVETAWDGDEWASHGETYNPRTGVASETSRYYNEDSNKSEMERTVERGDEWIQTERETDFDTGQSTTTRETSRGGSSTTTRDGTSSRTDFETGAGGSGTSISQDGERLTVGESAGGDLYAGHNGNVYKKTDDGWQTYDPEGGWSDARPEGAPERNQAQATQQTAREGGTQARQTAQPAPTGQARETQRPSTSSSMYGPAEYSRTSSGSRGYSSGSFGQLDRDASARRGGYSSFERNRSGGGGRQAGGRSRRR